MLGTMSDGALARRIGCTIQTIRRKRSKLGIRAYGRAKLLNQWGKLELGLLGMRPDAELARITGRTVAEITAKRKELGI
jgi:hypothetical protein